MAIVNKGKETAEKPATAKKSVSKETVKDKKEENLDFLEKENEEEEEESEQEEEEEQNNTPVASKAVKEKAKGEIKATSKGTNLSQKENGVKKIITLRAIFGKTQGPLKIRPVAERATGRIVTGQPYMSEDEKKRSVHPIDANTVETITDGKTYDLSDSVQKANWEWIKVHPYIAQDFETAQSSPQAMFYVEDLEADMDKKSSKIDQMYEAMTLVREASAVKRSEIMRLLGQDARFFTDKQVMGYLQDVCTNAPEKILRVFADKHYDLRLLLFKLIDKKIVVHAKGVYKYEDVNLGISEEQAIIFLSSVENRQLVGLLSRALNG